MNFTTPEGEFRLRLQKRYGNKWHAIGWPTATELRTALIANLATVAPFLQELVQLSIDREQSPAVCAPARVGDDSGAITPVPSPAGEARQGDLQTEGPAGEAVVLPDATQVDDNNNATPAGPDGAKSFIEELEVLINKYFMERASRIGPSIRPNYFVSDPTLGIEHLPGFVLDPTL